MRTVSSSWNANADDADAISNAPPSRVTALHAKFRFIILLLPGFAAPSVRAVAATGTMIDLFYFDNYFCRNAKLSVVPACPPGGGSALSRIIPPPSCRGTRQGARGLRACQRRRGRPPLRLGGPRSSRPRRR